MQQRVESTPHTSRLGAYASMAIGVTYLVGATSHMLSPEDGRAAAGPARYWPSVAEHPGYVQILDIAFIIGALCAFAAVPAIAARCSRAHGAWRDFAVKLGLVGFASAALVDATALGRMSNVSHAFVAGDASTRAAIAAEPVLLLDGYGVMMFLVPGLWMLIINVIAFVERSIARGWAVVGLLAATGFLCIPVGFATGIEAFIALGAVLSGVVLGPLWYIAMGVLMQRQTR